MSLKVSSDNAPHQRNLNFDDVRKAGVIIRALNNPLRRSLIDFLSKNQTATVTNLVFNLREEQTVISQHLNILRKAKIVTFLKKGKNVYYFLNIERVAEIQSALSKLLDDIPDEDLKNINKP